MLPVVRGERETTQQIVLYSLASLPSRFCRSSGAPRPLYLVGALAPRRGLLWARVGSPATHPGRGRIVLPLLAAYLALLFVAMALDPLIG